MKYLILLIALFITVNLNANNNLDLQLPNIGESANLYLSPEEERRLGESFMRGLRRSLVFVDDPIINEYLRTLGYQIVATSDASTRNFNFFVVDDNSINAFAGPGGHIGVNTGLILATDTESELAAVIAHEIAHVTQQHLARMVEMSERLSIPTIAALLAAIVIASQNGQVGEAAIAAAAAGSTQMQIDFLRGNEQEADRVGINALQRAGFEPRAMVGFFERLLKSTRYYDLGKFPEFLRDHPLTESRIADARNRAEQFSYRQRQDSLSYHLLRARLKIRKLFSPAQTVRELKQALDNGNYRNAAAARYAYALALIANHQSELARTEITKLLATDSERIEYLITQAELEIANNNFSKALAIYRQLQNLYPNNSAIIINQTQILLQINQPRTARDLLQGFMRNHQPEPICYKMLARIEEIMENLPASRELVAQYLYLTGETRTAINELRKIANLKQVDFYTNSRIDARIKELEEELAAENERNFK